MKRELIFYVYREWNSQWIFWRKFKERADAEGCLSEKPRMPYRGMYVGEELLAQLAD